MLTIVALILAGIFLAHVFADALKAAILVLLVAGVFYLARGVTFQALVDDGARAVWNGDHPSCRYHHHGEGI